MKYLLDTNICIYIIKKKPINILNKFKSLSIGDIGISSVTLAELSYGVEKSQYKNQNKEALNEFALPLEILHFDEKAAFHYGIIRANLEKKGIVIGAMDMMIAAHAQSMDLTLVTNNGREFTRVKDLSIENWV